MFKSYLEGLACSAKDFFFRLTQHDSNVIVGVIEAGSYYPPGTSDFIDVPGKLRCEQQKFRALKCITCSSSKVYSFIHWVSRR